MDRPRMERSLRRMAIQVWERLLQEDKELVLIGLNERGHATAEQLSGYLSLHMGEEVKAHRYEVGDKAAGKGLPECDDKFVLLVDDVIFSGKTMFEALSAVSAIFDPASIEIAALLDRGHRKYPLRTNLTGITVPTKLGEHIEVMLKGGKLNQAILFKNK